MEASTPSRAAQAISILCGTLNGHCSCVPTRERVVLTTIGALRNPMTISRKARIPDAICGPRPSGSLQHGALTPERARSIYDEITAQHRQILIPESARWGNQHGQNRGVRDWQNEYNRIVNEWFPVRRDILVGMLQSAGLYPRIEAPRYSQHGGSIAQGEGPLSLSPKQ